MYIVQLYIEVFLSNIHPISKMTHYRNQGLLDVTCKTVANMIKGEKIFQLESSLFEQVVIYIFILNSIDRKDTGGD